MEKVRNVLVLEKKGLDFEHVKQQVLAWHTNSLMVHATGINELECRLGWATFDFVLVNFSMPDCGALQVLLLVRKRFPTLPIVFIIDRKDRYSETEIEIIKQADGCVYHKDIFGQIGIIDDLMGASVNKRVQDGLVRNRRALMSEAIGVIQQGGPFKNQEAVLNLLETFKNDAGGEVAAGNEWSSIVGYRSPEQGSRGEDPHVAQGADAGAAIALKDKW